MQKGIKIPFYPKDSMCFKNAVLLQITVFTFTAGEPGWKGWSKIAYSNIS